MGHRLGRLAEEGSPPLNSGHDPRDLDGNRDQHQPDAGQQDREPHGRRRGHDREPADPHDRAQEDGGVRVPRGGVDRREGERNDRVGDPRRNASRCQPGQEEQQPCRQDCAADHCRMGSRRMDVTTSTAPMAIAIAGTT